MTGWIEGSVSILRCSECGEDWPQVTFSGDTDMTTSGLASLSSHVCNEVVIAEMSASEFADTTGRVLEERINRQLRRSDLRSIQVLRSEPAPIADGLSFQEFRKVYEPPRLVFACPDCDEGEGTKIASLSPAAFIAQGGKVTNLTERELRSDEET
jgi:hypothetical protein